VQTIATGRGAWVHRYFDEPSTPDITRGSSGGDVSLGIALVVPIRPIEEVIGKVGPEASDAGSWFRNPSRK
jgi:hypothetical protein